MNEKPTIGSLFAGIGGFDLGFERAGWETRWQVEIDPFNQAVLADRFPKAKRFFDVRCVGKKNLESVDCIVGGFPCQDLSSMGKRQGISGERSRLFYEAMRIVEELRPQWVVIENVTGLLTSSGGKDFERVLQAFAERGYVGLWRVLNARHFGVPQGRRRIFLVAGYRTRPPLELLADAATVDPIPSSFATERETRKADAWGWAYFMSKLRKLSNRFGGRAFRRSRERME